jgi:hypothetical protein
MYTFIIKATHENGTTLNMTIIADSFNQAFARVPVDKCISLSVVRSQR